MAHDDSTISIRVLGELTVDVDGDSIALPDSLRARALLCWLAVNPGPHPRSEIASALWPDVPDASARQSVRSALWSLRRALGERADAVLDTSRNRIGLRNVEVDLSRFDDFVATGRLDEALAMPNADLLAGIDDEWALIARDEHRARVIGLLAQASDAAAAAGDRNLALDRARAAAALDPLSESGVRLLMRRHAEAGDRSVALAGYTKLVDRLRRELRIAPSEETWRLAESIRNQRTPTTAGSAATERTVPCGGDLVGRNDERGQLFSAWVAARAGAGGLALVHGEPGIGKTRLIDDLADRARRDGAVVALGSAHELGGAPYGPWADLARSLLRGLGGVPDELFVAALAPLLPTLIAPSAPGPPELERARLTEGLLALVEYAAARGPVLAVLEDMHGCDEASAAVLARAGRRLRDLPILLVWTRRDRPIPPALASAEHSARHSGLPVTQVPVGRLSAPAVADLARGVGALDDEQIARVVTVAEGNPLLAIESARCLARGDHSLPDGLRATIGATMATLPPAAVRLAAVCAVAGRGVTVEELRRRLPDGGAELAEALRAGEDAGLLGIDGGRVGFRHALLGDACYAGLPELDRIELHGAIAHDLDERGGPENAAEAARHLRASGDRTGAATLLKRAAEHARSLGSVILADELLGAAAELAPDDLDIVLDAGEVAALRGSAERSDASFETALRLLGSSAEALTVATAHQRFAQWNTGALCRPRLAMAALRTALAALDRGRLAAPDQRVEILASLAWCEAVAGDPDESEHLLQQAESMLRPGADPVQKVKIANARSLALLRRGRFADAAEPGAAGARLARSIGRVDLAFLGTVNAAAGLAAIGAYDDAMVLLDDALAWPSDPGVLSMEAELMLSRAWVLSRLGRHGDALLDLHRAERIADHLGSERLATLTDAETGRTLLRSGAYAQAAVLLDRALRTSSPEIGRPLARLQRAEALARHGRLDQANDELNTAAVEPVRPSDWPDTLVARMSTVRGLIAAGRGDPEKARTEFTHAAATWQRRARTIDLGERITATLADLGHPVIGLVSPDEERRTVLADLARLEEQSCPPSTTPR